MPFESLIRLVSLTLGLTVVANCTPDRPADEADRSGSTADVGALVDDQMSRYLQLDPWAVTYYGVSEERVGAPSHDRFRDYSPAGDRAMRALVAELLAEVEAVPLDGLDATDRLTVEIARSMYGATAASSDIAYGFLQPLWRNHTPYVVSQLSGPHIDLPNMMANQQSVTTADEAADYLARLRAFGPTFDGVIAKLQADAAAGASPPRVLLERIAEGLDGVLQIPPADQDLITALSAKLAEADVTEAERSEILEEATDIMRDVVLPAYGRLRSEVAREVPTARDEDGVWALPEGELFYRHSVRQMTGSDLGPDEIHEIGLREVARIEEEIDALLRPEGMTEGTVGERLRALGADPAYLYPDTEEGHAELLRLLRDQVAEIRTRMPDYFGVLPPQQLQIRAVPEVSEASAAGGYYDVPSLDGTRPGIYWVNFRDMASLPSWSLATLSYHEGVPGHHHQLATAMNLGDMPLLRQLLSDNAFVEGWALYSEQLAMEMGLYADDPMGNVGRLRDELYRAVRLVVDTGLHHKRWTREQAIEYMTSRTGVVESDITAEIERYMAWPGQALGYKLGMLQILELRTAAQETMGEAFDLRAFHDVVLGAGSVPIDVMRGQVEAWVAGG
jgi:uncharacterized protein (DUF885 family)